MIISHKETPGQKSPFRYDDHDYGFLERCIDDSFNKYMLNNEQMFTTDVGNLFVLFLKYIPEEYRQHYNCNCCKSFINKYGGLVAIDEEGRLIPVMWELNSIPRFFFESIYSIREQVRNSAVTGVFYTDKKVLGTTESNGWSHLHVKLKQNTSRVRPGRLKTPYQERSDKLENFKLLKRSLSTYHTDVVKRAVTLLDTGSLYRGEKVLPNAKWFKKMKLLRPAIPNGRLYKNHLWREVAKAPEGFCHVSSNMLGTLLDDIKSGLHIDGVKRKFKKKMDPNIGGYQTPSSAPSDGNIDQAEKIIDKLGIELSLDRKYATIEEVPLIWHPSDSDFMAINNGEPVIKTGVFSHLRTNKPRNITSTDSMKNVIINWRDFKEDVLPSAEEISCYIAPGNLPLTAIVTAEHKDSPPILKWDTEEDRNPLSTYVYIDGSPASRWRLRQGTYVKVTGITDKPSMEKRDGVIFILEGCRDMNHMSAGLALFPEILKSELHSIRKSIEAFSRSKRLSGFIESTACGLPFNDKCPVILKVTTDGETVPYKIDRW